MRPLPFVLLSILLIGVTTMAICGMAFAIYVHKYINPNIDINLEEFRLNFTSKVVYEDKNTGEQKTLEELHGSENRVWADLDEIPKNLQHAFVAIEDARFYKHGGVDWKRTFGAAANYVLHFRDNFGGGSTITQQLIKNLTGEDETSVKRKVAEIMRAMALDKKYEKDDILEMYMNTIYLGQGANGVKTAALTYFGKEPKDLSLAECAAIAGITKNPYKYDPYRFPQFNKERRSLVLKQMLAEGYITKEEKEAADAEELVLTRDPSIDAQEKPWSYFVDEVFNTVVEDLMEQKGYSKTFAKQMIYTGGLTIVSTIDPEVQSKVDAVFQDTKNFPGVLGKDGKMPQAAMVIMDQHTGNVVAMYGGRGVKEGNLVLNRATRTKRSPGSSIKPISVYAPAIEYGLITPITVLDDVPKNFSIKASGWPKNSTNGGVWSGRMTVKKAVELSTNTIPVGLLQELTPRKAFDFAHLNMGLESLVESRTITNKKGQTFKLSDVDYSPLALGGLTDGVSVMEMTAAYCAFGNDGKYTKPRVYTKVYDAKGEVLLDNEPQTTVAMSQKTADYMLDLLTNVVTGPQGTGARAKIQGIETGGKTGTTDDDYDRWFMGLTPYYTGGVWFGYDTPQVVKGVSSNPALALWKAVMQEVHAGLPNAQFERKTEYVTVNYCLDSGLLANEYCSADPRGSRITSGRVAKEDVPKKQCDVHVGVKVDMDTLQKATEFCPADRVKTVGMLDITRNFPVSVAVSDSKYIVPKESCTVHNATNNGNKPTEEPGEGDTKPSNPNSGNNGGQTETPETPTKPTKPTKPTEPENGNGNSGNQGGGTNTPHP